MAEPHAAGARAALSWKWSPAFSRPGPLTVTSRDCPLCVGLDCECADIEFGSARYLAKLDAIHGRQPRRNA
jgi:hypothetical protein